jgi:hypothetical protein
MSELGERIIAYLRAWKEMYPNVDVLFPSGEPVYEDTVRGYAKDHGWRYHNLDECDSYPGFPEGAMCLEDFEELWINGNPLETKAAFQYVRENTGWEFHVFFAMGDGIRVCPDGYESHAYVFVNAVNPDGTSDTEWKWIDRALAEVALGKMIEYAPQVNLHGSWKVIESPFHVGYARALYDYQSINRGSLKKQSPYIQNHVITQAIAYMRSSKRDAEWLQQYVSAFTPDLAQEHITKYGYDDCMCRVTLHDRSIVYECLCEPPQYAENYLDTTYEGAELAKWHSERGSESAPEPKGLADIVGAWAMS